MSDRTYYSEEAKARAMRENAVAVAKALVAGIALGAAGGLLINPETRKQIARTSLKQADHAADEAKGIRKLFAKRIKENRKQAACSARFAASLHKVTSEQECEPKFQARFFFS